MDFPGLWAAELEQTQLRKERRSHRVLRLWVSPASRKRRRGSRRSRTPPRRAHDTLQPQDESIIVGYYTSAEVHPPKATRISTALVGRERSSMARGDGIHRTSARNMRLTTPKLKNAQQHNEREKESYVNQDIVPERSHLNVHFKKPDGGYLEQFGQMEADGIISTRGIREDAFRYGELIFDVNSAYFFNHGGYDFAKQFYHDAYQLQSNRGRRTVHSVGGHARRRAQPGYVRGIGAGCVPLPPPCGLCAGGGEADPLVQTVQGQVVDWQGKRNGHAGQYEQEMGVQAGFG